MPKNKPSSEIIQTIFFFILFLLAGAALINLPRLAIPLSISYVFYLIINPTLPQLMKFGLSRGFSIVILFVGVILLAVYPVIKIVPTITQETQNFQYYIPKAETYIKTKYEEARVKVLNKTGFELRDKYLEEILEIGKKSTTSFLLNLPTFLASIIEWLFLVPLFVFFLLKDGDKFKSILLRLAPNSIFERYYYLSYQFNRQLGDYIFAKFVEASIVGLIITIGLLIIDVRFSFLLGLIAGMTNVIPYVGPVIGMIPALVYALVEYGAGPTFGWILTLYLTANAIDIGLVFPILVSKIVNLHPIVVVVSVILGSQYFGIIGMVISIPLAAAIKLIFLEIYNEIYMIRTRG